MRAKLPRRFRIWLSPNFGAGAGLDFVHLLYAGTGAGLTFGPLLYVGTAALPLQNLAKSLIRRGRRAGLTFALFSLYTML